MKITVTFKDPDGCYNSVQDAVRDSLRDIKDIDEDEAGSIFEKRLEKTWDKLEKFIDCQEYVRIEFDLDAGTATVLKNGG